MDLVPSTRTTFCRTTIFIQCPLHLLVPRRGDFVDFTITIQSSPHDSEATDGSQTPQEVTTAHREPDVAAFYLQC